MGPVGQALESVENLDRDLAVDFGIVGQKDPPHGAVAQLLDDPVSAERRALHDSGR